MVQVVIRNWLILLLLGGNFIHANGQNKPPQFQIPLGNSYGVRNSDTNLSTFLAAGFTPKNRGMANCSAHVTFFHFRVDIDGTVDSVYTNGYGDIDVIKAVTKNIYNTNKLWNVSESKSQKWWFVFPYFIFGKTTMKCSSEDQLKYDEILFLYRHLDVNQMICENNLVRIPPNKNAEPIVK